MGQRRVMPARHDRLLRIRGLSAVGRLDISIAERQRRQAVNRLRELEVPLRDRGSARRFARNLHRVAGGIRKWPLLRLRAGARHKLAESISRHLRTNAELLGYFLPVSVEINGATDPGSACREWAPRPPGERATRPLGGCRCRVDSDGPLT
jgi:hypothetical protein